MEPDRDEKRVSLDPLDPVTALKGLLKVDPESPPASKSPEKPPTKPRQKKAAKPSGGRS